MGISNGNNMQNTVFQKTLYRRENNIWHYIRLTWHETAQSFEVSAAPCGHAASPIRQEGLLPGETKETALHRLALALRQVGYWEQPIKEWLLDVQVFTPSWDGFTAAAPWFDALQFDILYPLYEILEHTANGGNNGGTRADEDCQCYFLWVAEPAAAKEAVDHIARQAPSLFQVVAHIRRRGEKPVPGKPPKQEEGECWEMEIGMGLADKMIKHAESLAYVRSLPENQPIPDKTYPDNVCGLFNRSDPDRLRGEKAGQLRERLLTQWGVGKGFWPPLGNAAPCETLHVEGMDEELAARLIAIVQKRTIGQVYAFDASEGIFVSEPERILSMFQIDDTYWFDDGLEWVIFASHENTVTFGGEWLLKEVRDVFREQPETLNPWW